jgi:hypothetical protein
LWWNFSFSYWAQPNLNFEACGTRNHPLTEQQVEENKVIEDARRRSFFHSIFSSFQSSNIFW